MAKSQLTERQQEIKNLMDKGRTPAEIGEALDITTNAVYQQLRRMSNRSGKPAAKSTTKAKTASKPAAKRTPAKRAPAKRPSRPTPAPAPAPAPEPRVMTPLQAIRARRTEIESVVKESKATLDAAVKAANAAKETHEKLVGQRRDELSALEKAEAAITGRPVIKAAPKTQRQSGGKQSPAASAKGNGKPATPAVAPPAEAPASAPAAPAAAQAPAVPAAEASPPATLAPDAAPGVADPV